MPLISLSHPSLAVCIVLVGLKCHLTCIPLCMPRFRKQTLSQHRGYTTKRTGWHSGREVMCQCCQCSSTNGMFGHQVLWELHIRSESRTAGIYLKLSDMDSSKITSKKCNKRTLQLGRFTIPLNTPWPRKAEVDITTEAVLMSEICLLAVGGKGKHPGRLDKGHAQFEHWSEGKILLRHQNNPQSSFHR